jgi:hypothetical protein
VKMGLEVEGFIDPWLFGPLDTLTYHLGLVGTLTEWIDERIAAQADIHMSKQEGLAVDEKKTEIFAGVSWTVMPLCIRCGMASLARVAWDGLYHISTWLEAEAFFAEVWGTFGAMLQHPNVGGEPYHRRSFLLYTFLMHGDSPDAAREMVGDEATIDTLDRTCLLTRFSSITSLVEFAALVAEKLGDDALASRYATTLVKRYEKWQPWTFFTGHMVLGRVAQRRGERSAALRHFECAAAHVLDSMFPLYALHAGAECGGDEGARIIDRAVQVIGRPRAELLSEFGAACGIELE